MGVLESIILVVGTLAGTLVGIFATYLFNRRIEFERRKHEREMEHRNEIKKHTDDLIKPLFKLLQNLWESLGVLQISLDKKESILKGKTIDDLLTEAQNANQALRAFMKTKYDEICFLLPSPFPWIFAPLDELVQYRIIEPISQGKKLTDDITVAINQLMRIQKDLRRIVGFEMDVELESSYPFKKVTSSRNSEKMRDFGGIFDVALVLLGVLSATETQYFIKVFGDTIALRFATLPFVILIPVWVITDLYKAKIPIENYLFSSEFCWEIWSLTLVYYLLFLYLYLIPNIPLIAYLEGLAMGGVMYVAILFAYYLEYKTVARYYKSRKWILYRFFKCGCWCNSHDYNFLGLKFLTLNQIEPCNF